MLVLDDRLYKRAQSNGNGRVGSESAVLHAIWIKRGSFVSRLCCERGGWVGQGAFSPRPPNVYVLPASSISHCCIVCPSIGNNTARGAKHP
jgi:hypothetical protein